VALLVAPVDPPVPFFATDDRVAQAGQVASPDGEAVDPRRGNDVPVEAEVVPVLLAEFGLRGPRHSLPGESDFTLPRLPGGIIVLVEDGDFYRKRFPGRYARGRHEAKLRRRAAGEADDRSLALRQKRPVALVIGRPSDKSQECALGLVERLDPFALQEEFYFFTLFQRRLFDRRADHVMAGVENLCGELQADVPRRLAAEVVIARFVLGLGEAEMVGEMDLDDGPGRRRHRHFNVEGDAGDDRTGGEDVRFNFHPRLRLAAAGRGDGE